MPLAAKNNLDELYARQRLLQEAAQSLDDESERLGEAVDEIDRRYILEIQSDALREEYTKISALISDILERDLQR